MGILRTGSTPPGGSIEAFGSDPYSGPAARKRTRHSSKDARKTGAFRTMRVERDPVRTMPIKNETPFERYHLNRNHLTSQESRPNKHRPVSWKDRPIAPKRASYALGAGGHCRVNCSQKRPFMPSPSRRRPSAVASSCPAKLMLSAAMRHSPSASRTASTS